MFETHEDYDKLPSEWVYTLDEHGRPFYYNKIIDQSIWVFPLLLGPIDDPIHKTPLLKGWKCLL
jgi:hypothetical protein